MTTTYTTHYRFPKPAFDVNPWHSDFWTAMDRMDTVLYNIQNLVPISTWAVSTAYTLGRVVIDSVDATSWLCKVAHTSRSSGAMSDDRTAHATYWQSVSFGVQARGAWANSTAYVVNDLAYDTTLGFVVLCTVAHTSSASPATLTTDIANWVKIIDLSTAAAANIPFTPAGAVAATNVQTAIEEVDTEKAPKASPTFTGTVTIPTPTAGDDSTKAASTAFVAAAIVAIASNLATRTRVRVATTANITIATALNNADTLDGIALVTGDLVLVKDQSAPAQNGVYVVGVTPARYSEYDTYNEHPGTLISVAEGTAGADTLWLCTSNNGGTIDATSIVFAQLGPFQASDADLTALAANSTDGFWAHTGAGTGAARTLTAGTAITISNPAGIAGNPTVAADIGLMTMFVPAGAMVANTTNGPAPGTVEVATNLTMLKTLDYDTTTQESAQFAVKMPASWNLGTVTAQAVWKHAATSVNFGVVWDIAAGAYSDAEDPTTFGTAVLMTDTGGTTNRIYISPVSAAVTVANTPASGDWVVFRVRRVPADGSDTMAIDAGLLGIIVLFTINALKDG